MHNKIIILVFVKMTNLMITVAIMVIIVVIIVVMIAGRQAGNSTILNLVSELGHTRYLFDATDDADGAVVDDAGDTVDDNEDTVDDVGDTFDDKWLAHFLLFLQSNLHSLHPNHYLLLGLKEIVIQVGAH